MKISELYEKYEIMPQLVKHQLRVGAIVKLLNGNDEAVKTALVHDMGNLAKFTNLDQYWGKKQKIFWKKFGNDAHRATIQILEDSKLHYLAKLVQEESELYKNIIEADLSKYSDAATYTLYGDSRVAIDGVVTMEERIVDLETRYRMKRNDRIWAGKLENYIINKSGVEARTITEQSVTPLFQDLLSYNV